MTGPQGALIPAGSVVDVTGWANVQRQVRTGHLVAVEDGHVDALLDPLLRGEHPAPEVLDKSSLNRFTVAKLARRLRPVGAAGPSTVPVEEESAMSADTADMESAEAPGEELEPELAPANLDAVLSPSDVAPVVEPALPESPQPPALPKPMKPPKKWGRKR